MAHPKFINRGFVTLLLILQPRFPAMEVSAQIQPQGTTVGSPPSAPSPQPAPPLQPSPSQAPPASPSGPAKATPAKPAPTKRMQTDCKMQGRDKGLSGRELAAFVKTCMKG
jgi:hypothetical protein